MAENYQFPHEKLQVWHSARALAKMVYDKIAAFPKHEQFGLTSQLRRSSVSVMSNLAEGSGRTSARDQAHFSQMAYGSLLELDAQFQLSVDLGFLDAYGYEEVRAMIDDLAVKISALRTSQVNRCK